MTTPTPHRPHKIVGWMLVVAGAVDGVAVKFHHGLWTGPNARTRAEAAAGRWQAALIRAGKNYAVSAAPLHGRGLADLHGTWATVEAAMAKVRNTTHVEKASP